MKVWVFKALPGSPNVGCPSSRTKVTLMFRAREPFRSSGSLRPSGCEDLCIGRHCQEEPVRLDVGSILKLKPLVLEA